MSIFYKRFFALVLPISLQQFVTIMLNMVDNIMVGQLGVEAIAAVSFANKIFFVFLLSVIGLSAGSFIFISQLYGKRDFQRIYQIIGFSVIFVFLLSLCFAIPAFIFSAELMWIFSRKADVITLASEYFRITVFMYPLLAVTYVIIGSFRSIGIAKYGLYITVVVTILNTILNYLLIYGNFGFPRLETEGAAIATLIARVIEFIAALFLILSSNSKLKATLKEYLAISKKMLKSVIKLTIPVFFNEASWALGTTILAIAYATLGTEAAAIISIADIIVNVGVIVFIGIATAASIMIAQELGAGKMMSARVIAHKIVRLSLIIGVIIVIVASILVQPVLSIYNISQSVKDLAEITLYIFAGSLFFKMFNWVLLVGILRAGGDVKVVLFADAIFLAVYAIPIAFVAALYWQLPIYYVVLLANLEEIMKFIVGMWRYLTGKWIRDIT